MYHESSLSPEELAAVNLQKGIKKSESRAIRDLGELLYESGDTHDNFEFDYNTGEFLEVIYTTPEMEFIPLRKKSITFPSLQNLLCLTYFVEKLTEEVTHLQLSHDSSSNLTDEQNFSIR